MLGNVETWLAKKMAQIVRKSDTKSKRCGGNFRLVLYFQNFHTFHVDRDIWNGYGFAQGHMEWNGNRC